MNVLEHEEKDSFGKEMSRCVRKPTICIFENKDADQRLYIRHTDSTFPLLLISKASSLMLLLYSLGFVGPGRKPKFLVSHAQAQIRLVIYIVASCQVVALHV